MSRQTTEPAALAEITRATRQRACLFAAPVLAEAAELLTDLLAAGERRGVAADAWDVDLAGGCLDVVSQTVVGVNAVLDPDVAKALLDAVVTTLAEQDPPIAATRDGWTVCLSTEPALQTGYRHPLVLSCTAGTGWSLAFDRPGGMIPMALISAGFDLADAAHVAGIVARVNRGEAGFDPFNGRR